MLSLEIQQKILSLVRSLAKQQPLARAEMAEEVAREMKSTMAQVRREAIYEATRTDSYEDVAKELGIAVETVRSTVKLHNKRAAA